MMRSVSAFDTLRVISTSRAFSGTPTASTYLPGERSNSVSPRVNKHAGSVRTVVYSKMPLHIFSVGAGVGALVRRVGESVGEELGDTVGESVGASVVTAHTTTSVPSQTGFAPNGQSSYSSQGLHSAIVRPHGKVPCQTQSILPLISSPLEMSRRFRVYPGVSLIAMLWLPSVSYPL